MTTKKEKYAGALKIEGEPSSYPTVVWFDPGGTTGWCILTFHPDSMTDPECPVLDNITFKHWGQIPGAGKDDESENLAFSKALDIVGQWPGAVVGTESFTLRQFTQDSELLTPVRFNKVLSYAVWAGGHGEVQIQSPSLAKKTVTDERLRGWSLYDSSSGGHARDAQRHALTFLRRCKSQAKLRKEVWPEFYED